MKSTQIFTIQISVVILSEKMRWWFLNIFRKSFVLFCITVCCPQCTPLVPLRMEFQVKNWLDLNLMKLKNWLCANTSSLLQGCEFESSCSQIVFFIPMFYMGMANSTNVKLRLGRGSLYSNSSPTRAATEKRCTRSKYVSRNNCMYRLLAHLPPTYNFVVGPDFN